MTSVEKIEQMLLVARNKVESLETMLEEAKAEEMEKLANENAINAVFDGIKLVADAEHPMTLVLPMRVVANMFYVEGEGEGAHKYVCVKNGIVTEDNVEEYLEPWED